MKRKLVISLADKIIGIIETSIKNPESHFNTHLDFAVKKLDDDHNAYCRLCNMKGLGSLMSCTQIDNKYIATSSPVFIDVFGIPKNSDSEAYRTTIGKVIEEDTTELITHAIADVKELYDIDVLVDYEVRCYPIHKLQDPQPIWHIEVKARVEL